MGTVELDLLELFVTVSRAASYSAAARTIGVPKSSVSRGIARLEEELGVVLLHRTTRRVALSTAGAALFERVAPRLAALRESLGELPELGEEPSGDLRVTAPTDFGASVLADVAAAFSLRYPAVRLDLRITNRQVDLVAEGFDLAVRASPRMKDSSLVARKVAAIPSHVYAAPHYLARRGTPRTPAEVAGHEWVVFRRPGPVSLRAPGETARVHVDGRIACDDMGFLREAVRAGAGLGLLPAFLAEGSARAGQLVRVLPRWELGGGSLWIVVPSTRRVPRKVTAFRDFLLEALHARPLLSAG